MTEIKLVYNPYRVQTDLFIKNSIGKEERVNSFSKLDWISKTRLQRWVNRSSNGYWKGFFYELAEISGDKELFVNFIGTEDDFNDLKIAAKKFENSCNGKVVLKNLDVDSQSSLTSEAKLSKLNEEVNTAKLSVFYTVFPKGLRDYLDNGFVRKNADIKFLLVSEISDSSLKQVFACDAWSSVCFCCDLSELNSEIIKANIQSIVKHLLLLKNIDAERERFSFVFLYNDEISDSLTEIRNIEKRFFLEQGIPDFPYYSVSKQNVEKLMNGFFDKNSFDDGIAKISTDWDIYQKRYAEQIRLYKSCGTIESYIEKFSLNKSSIRRSISVSSIYKHTDTEDERILTENESLLRLYFQLSSWNYEEELNSLIGNIKTEIKKSFVVFNRKIDSPEYCTNQNNKQYIAESNLDRFSKWYKNAVRELLQIEMKKFYEKIEVNWSSHFFEAFDEYTESLPRNQSDWLPKYIQAPSDIESPVTRLNGLEVNADYVKLNNESVYFSNEKYYEFKDLLSLYNHLIQIMFDDWFKSVFDGLIRIANEIIANIYKRIAVCEKGSTKSGARYLYRDNIEKEAKIKDEAVKWINDFIDTINHLLDVGVPNNQ